MVYFPDCTRCSWTAPLFFEETMKTRNPSLVVAKTTEAGKELVVIWNITSIVTWAGQWASSTKTRLPSTTWKMLYLLIKTVKSNGSFLTQAVPGSLQSCIGSGNHSRQSLGVGASIGIDVKAIITTFTAFKNTANTPFRHQCSQTLKLETPDDAQLKSS